jgi:hypothetical protein
MHLLPLSHENKDDGIVRACEIKKYDDDILIDKKNLWFELAYIESYPEDKDCESYLIAMLLEAMQENRNLIVHGSVSRELLSNLTEYQSIWNKWLPETFHLVDIQVEIIIENNWQEIKQVTGAICAFSGGVDSTFSLWRNSQNKNSYRSQKINFGVLVHGFDIPLSDKNAFNNTLQRSQKLLETIGVNLLPIRTNYRNISKVNWEYAFATALIGVLSNYKNLADTIIIGSGNPYNYLAFPWGSTPITDHLLSSRDFRVIHDGASYNRIEKVQAIAAWKEGYDNLRVCWQGKIKDRNCGKCEKCIRTQANCLASNLPIPSSFPNKTITDKDLQTFRIANDYIKVEWQIILATAKKNNLPQNIIQSIESLLSRYKWESKIKYWNNKLLPKGSNQRKIVRNIIKKVKFQ